ncbi:hypothetical protein OIU78_017415, partial [Salix suchowensis]
MESGSKRQSQSKSRSPSAGSAGKKRDGDDGMLKWDLQTLITTPLDLLLLVLDIYTVPSEIAKHKQ